MTWRCPSTDLGLTHHLMGFSTDCWLRQCSPGLLFQYHNMQAMEYVWRLQNHTEGNFPRAENATHSQKTGLPVELTPKADGSAWWLPSTLPPLFTGIFSGERSSPPPAIAIL